MPKAFYILALICFANSTIVAQHIKRFNTANIPSTSFYDIYPLNENQFILAGKNGVISACNKDGNMQLLKENSNSANLLKSIRINDSLIMVIGDKGRIYTLNTNDNTWNETFLSRFENKALYNTCSDKNGNLYINGGHSKIACGQAAVPHGFILKSTDGGKNWEKIYSRFSKMVWDVKFNPADEKLYAIVYSPFGSKLLSSSNEGKTWKTILKSEKKDLFHALYITSDGKIMISGGNYSNNGGKGAIYEINGNEYIKHTTTYFVWDIVSTPEIDIASCSKGWIVYRIKSTNNTNWQEMHSTADYNLYEVEKISDTSFLLGGSRKTLIRFDLEAPEQVLKK
ncbi:MAG: WD40/YVTN/BNR-like repeat-containing protein [Bacteroidia bacterium]